MLSDLDTIVSILFDSQWLPLCIILPLIDSGWCVQLVKIYAAE